jgi:hypothetical protein
VEKVKGKGRDGREGVCVYVCVCVCVREMQKARKSMQEGMRGEAISSKQQWYQELRPLEVARRHTHVVLLLGVVKLGESPVD